MGSVYRARPTMALIRRPIECATLDQVGLIPVLACSAEPRRETKGKILRIKRYAGGRLASKQECYWRPSRQSCRTSTGTRIGDHAASHNPTQLLDCRCRPASGFYANRYTATSALSCLKHRRRDASSAVACGPGAAGILKNTWELVSPGWVKPATPSSDRGIGDKSRG